MTLERVWSESGRDAIGLVWPLLGRLLAAAALRAVAEGDLVLVPSSGGQVIATPAEAGEGEDDAML